MIKRYKSYEPIPFWFINDDFDRDEIVAQLNIMQAIGVDAFFLHVRDGNVCEGYGTELFFNNVKFIVEKARERNIKVWLYDEDSYPSGNLGGKIVIDRPELQAHALKVIKLDAKGGGIVRQVLGRVKGYGNVCSGRCFYFYNGYSYTSGINPFLVKNSTAFSGYLP